MALRGSGPHSGSGSDPPWSRLPDLRLDPVGSSCFLFRVSFLNRANETRGQRMRRLTTRHWLSCNHSPFPTYTMVSHSNALRLDTLPKDVLDNVVAFLDGPSVLALMQTTEFHHLKLGASHCPHHGRVRLAHMSQNVCEECLCCQDCHMWFSSGRTCLLCGKKSCHDCFLGCRSCPRVSCNVCNHDVAECSRCKSLVCERCYAQAKWLLDRRHPHGLNFCPPCIQTTMDPSSPCFALMWDRTSFRRLSF